MRQRCSGRYRSDSSANIVDMHHPFNVHPCGDITFDIWTLAQGTQSTEGEFICPKISPRLVKRVSHMAVRVRQGGAWQRIRRSCSVVHYYSHDLVKSLAGIHICLALCLALRPAMSFLPRGIWKASMSEHLQILDRSSGEIIINDLGSANENWECKCSPWGPGQQLCTLLVPEDGTP